MMKAILNCIRGFFKRKHCKPAQLPAEVRAAIAREADFLRKSHGVMVHELAPGEKPDLPKEATSGQDVPRV